MDWAFGRPTLESVWRICLARLEGSTTSWSTIEMYPEIIRSSRKIENEEKRVSKARSNTLETLLKSSSLFFLQSNSPTPAAARYWMAGQPRPPAPMTSTFEFLNFNWDGRPKSERIICLPYREYSGRLIGSFEEDDEETGGHSSSSSCCSRDGWDDCISKIRMR